MDKLKNEIKEIKSALQRANIPLKKEEIKQSATSTTAIRYSRKSAGNRKKKACPYWTIEVVHLPRHLRQKHNKTPVEARLAVARNRDIIKGSGSTVRKYRECPIKKCKAKVKYLSQHLKSTHRYESDRAAALSRTLRYNKDNTEISEETDADKNSGTEIDVHPAEDELREDIPIPSTSMFIPKALPSKEKVKEENRHSEICVHPAEDEFREDIPIPSTSMFIPKALPSKEKITEENRHSEICVHPAEDEFREDIPIPSTSMFIPKPLPSKEKVKEENRHSEICVHPAEDEFREDIPIPSTSKFIPKALPSKQKVTEEIRHSEICVHPVEDEFREWTVPEVFDEDGKKIPAQVSTLFEDGFFIIEVEPAINVKGMLVKDKTKDNSNPGFDKKDFIVVEEKSSTKVDSENDGNNSIYKQKDGDQQIQKNDHNSEEQFNELILALELRKTENKAQANVETNIVTEKKVLTLEEIIEEGVTITPIGKAVTESQTNKTDKTKKIISSKPRPWLKRKKIRNWREVPALKEYNAFCRSAERNLNIKHADQQCSQLLVIWMAVDSQGLFRTGNITNADRLAEMWLEECVKNKQPGTVKAYLSTLQDFWSYLSMRKLIKSALLTELNSRRTLWLKRLRKKSKERSMEVMVRDSNEMLSIEEFENFKTSDIKGSVWGILKKKTNLTQADFNLVVGFIALTIAINNAQRCGAILGLSLQGFANRLQEEDSFICTVLKHKTGYLHPCQLVLTKELSNMINHYLQARRRLPLLRSENSTKLLAPDAPLFLQWPGREMDNSQMNKLINRVWSKAGGKQRVSFTKIRKAVVTRFREVRPQSRLALARHMTHMPSTADKYYSLKEKKKKIVEISKEISQVMSSKMTTPDNKLQPEPSFEIVTNDKATESKEADDENVDKTKEGFTSVKIVTKSEKQIETESELSMEEKATDLVSVSQSSHASHGRRTFTKEEQNLIESSCKEIITDMDRSIRQGDVIYALEETEEGRLFLEKSREQFGKMAGKKITDRVRTFRRDLFKFKT